MITYIVKTVLCSGLFILVYYLILEREKIYRFNRGYLLIGIALSFIIPLISIRVRPSADLVPVAFYQADTVIQSTYSQSPMTNGTENISLKQVFLLIYGAITLFFMAKFVLNIFSLLRKVRHSDSVKYLNGTFILTKDQVIPFSFLKYVFINNEDLKQGRIENEILSHELTHVRQKHSIDILSVELLLVFAWINPFLFLYRKAIQLNHEFLADESVIQNTSGINNYQLLLIGKANHINRLWLSSQFNYLQTKKRIIMMSKQASIRTAIMKQVALLPVLAAAVMLFSTKVIAQDNGTVQYNQEVISTQSGVSQELLKEYQDIINKYERKHDNGKGTIMLPVSVDDKERLEKIFYQMSSEQQKKQNRVFVPVSSMILTKKVPTEEQIKSFKDPEMYGIWIDRKRVSNDVMVNYKNTDFAWVSVSKLMKNATNYGKHVYQVNLMTNEEYQRYYDERITSKENILVSKYLVYNSDNKDIKNSTQTETQLKQQDPDFESWWKSIAKKHAIKYESYTVHEPFVIIGKKTVDGDTETYDNVIAIAKGLSKNKGENVYSLIKSERATYGYSAKYNHVALVINDCAVEQYDGNSQSLVPIESRALKIFVSELQDLKVE